MIPTVVSRTTDARELSGAGLRSLVTPETTGSIRPANEEDQGERVTTPQGKLKVFISWSMPLSHAVAKALRDWLPRVIQDIEPWVSSEDIEKGTYWTEEIVSNLDAARVGIIVVTPENYERSWLNFEAGALGRSIKASRGIVAPLLIDMDTNSIQGPMTTLQITNFNLEDIRKLLQSINHRTRTPLDTAILFDQVELLWPKLDQSIADIIEEQKQPRAPKLTDRDILEELLTGFREIRRQDSQRSGVNLVTTKSSDRLTELLVSRLFQNLRMPDAGLVLFRTANGELMAISRAPSSNPDAPGSHEYMELLRLLTVSGMQVIIIKGGRPILPGGVDLDNPPNHLDVVFMQWPDE